MLKLNIQPDDVCFALKDDEIAKKELSLLMWIVCHTRFSTRLSCPKWIWILERLGNDAQKRDRLERVVRDGGILM